MNITTTEKQGPSAPGPLGLQPKTPTTGKKEESSGPPEPPTGIESESSSDTAVSAAALLAVSTNWTQLLKQLEGLNTSISGVKKTVTEARKGLKRNTPMPVQQNMEDANTHIAELGSIQKLIETYVEGLKNGMTALQPRPINIGMCTGVASVAMATPIQLRKSKKLNNFWKLFKEKL